MLPIRVLLNIILTKYFINSRCLVLISDNFDWNLNNNNYPIPLIVFNNSYFITHSEMLFKNFGCQHFLADVKDPLGLIAFLEKKIKLHQDRFNNRKYLFLLDEPKRFSSLKEIEFISDLLLIIPDVDKMINDDGKNSCFTLWTHKYKGLRGNNDIYLLDKWFARNESFLFNNNLFPDKLSDQEGRILRVAIFPYEPYIIVERKNDSYFYMGSEMKTILTLSEYLNMTLKPIINEFDYWGEIWTNWSGNGLMGNLVEDRADIGAAALYTWEFAYKYLDLSKPTVRTGITCLVPAPKPAPAWMTIIHTYTVQTWLAVIASFLMSFLVLYFFSLLKFHYKNGSKSNFLNGKAKLFGEILISVFKPFVMQPITSKEIPHDWLGQYLMGLVFVTTLVLSTTYSSGLATIMTVPLFEEPINTVDQFVASGLHWGATQDAWIMSIQNAKEPNLVKLVAKFQSLPETALRKQSLTGKFAFSVERLPNDNYAIGPYLQKDAIQNFHLMSNDFYWEQCVIMMRKNSILLSKIDSFILRVFEAGLISFWQNEAATEYMDQYVQKAVKYFYHHKKRDIVKLKITHLQGAFGILFIGHYLALITFLVETFYYYKLVKY